jgi:hypothetical protein
MPGDALPLLRRSSAALRTSRTGAAGPRRALLVVDQQRLQGAAWAEFHTARKRLEKATRNLHRHEEVDTPAFESWLHRTFPLLVTTLRELHAQLSTKARKVEVVQATAYFSGRSAKRLWREQKLREMDPDEPGTETGSRPGGNGPPPDDDEADRLFEPGPHATRSRTAREMYRRLVQHLHPDRGGEWSTHRQRLWHEVQQAWAAGDADWLSRLEVDWETANEILGPSSPLSRIYRGIAELDAARRDTERKLREYRSAPAWRFTLAEKRRPFLHRRTEANMQAEIEYLRREVRHLDTLIASWEEDWTRADSRPKSGRRRRAHY